MVCVCCELYTYELDITNNTCMCFLELLLHLEICVWLVVLLCCRCWLSWTTASNESTQAVAWRQPVSEQFTDNVTRAQWQEDLESISAWNETATWQHCFTACYIWHSCNGRRYCDTVDCESDSVELCLIVNFKHSDWTEFILFVLRLIHRSSIDWLIDWLIDW